MHYLTEGGPSHDAAVVGWQGTLTVFKLNIRDIRSIGSERIHLPPSMHCTMIATGITICTFTPRRFESDPAASRVPAYHRNVDYDEVVFTHSGAMFSRTREQSTGGILSLPPQITDRVDPIDRKERKAADVDPC